MPDILYIASQIPWPLKSGLHLRQYHILEALSKIGDVHLVALNSKNNTSAPEELHKLCKNIALQPKIFSDNDNKSLGYIKRTQNLIKAFFGIPEELRVIPENFLSREVSKVLQKSYDLIWIERINSAAALKIDGGTNVVLDLDDIEHKKNFLRLTLSDKKDWKYWRFWLNSRALRKAELKRIKKYVRVLVCSSTDADYLSKENIDILPNGTLVCPNEIFNPGVLGRLIFVGLLSYKPNIDALQFFVREVLPLIRKVIPEAYLEVIGRNPRPAVLSLDDGTTVKIIGEVKDVAPYIREASISVVPIRFGGGTRLKILESLALKTPVVSTTVGAEGLELVNGQHILTADSPSDFAHCCIRLLKDESLRQQFSESGYEQVNKIYPWSVIENKAIKIASEILSNSKRQSSKV